MNNSWEEIYKKRPDLLICIFLIISTLAVYWPIHGYDFISFDDNEYVYDNPHVYHGITVDNIIWAFTAFHSNNWHPLTWISHMLDCQFFGINPGFQHLINLFFHITNALLLFLIFNLMTGHLWKAGLIAALFALHPLHVESVAWISERKDVLSAFFWMLTMWSYIRYVKRPTISNYIWIILFFIFGLMSKPIVVTLPFVLLLMDYWPLNRFQHQPWSTIQKGGTTFRLVLEKTPLFILLPLSCFLTYCAQKQGGVLKSLEIFPLKIRIANALVSYIKYIGKMIYPINLACLYPYPRFFPSWEVLGACLLLGCFSFFAVKRRKEHPYLIVGWLWFLGTLIPVIGLVQVGMQAIADRYTYISLIGLFVIIAWGIPNLLGQWRHRKILLPVSAIIIISILSVITLKQVTYWRNRNTIYEHALQTTSNNYLTHNSLGNVLMGQDRTDEAIQNYLSAIRINPDFSEAYYNLGNAYLFQGRTQEAIQNYLSAVRINHDNAEAYHNLGNALLIQGHIQEAIQNYLQALRIKPDYVLGHYNLGVAYLDEGDIDKSMACLNEALRLNPSDHNIQDTIKKVLAIQKQHK